MSDKFTVEIISPDRSIIKVDTTEVIIPAYEGCLLYTSDAADE